MAAGLAELPVDLIVTWDTLAALAAKQVISSISLRSKLVQKACAPSWSSSLLVRDHRARLSAGQLTSCAASANNFLRYRAPSQYPTPSAHLAGQQPASQTRVPSCLVGPSQRCGCVIRGHQAIGTPPRPSSSPHGQSPKVP